MDGKGIVSERHPLAVGVFSESGHSSAWKAFREADVVLAIGNSLNQHATFGLREDLFDGKTLIQINISATEIGKTYLGRDIIALKVTKNAKSTRDNARPAVLYNAQQHAREAR